MDFDLKKSVKKVLVSEREIQKLINQLGKKISEDYKGKNLLLIAVLKGAVVTLTDLMRAITIPCEIDFMVVSSYADATESSGRVRILKDLDVSIEGRDVLIVEDILDSGNTLSYLTKVLSHRNPASIKICTLLDKPARRQADIKADYVGKAIADEFVIGYGLDFAGKFRNLPYVAIIKPEVPEQYFAEKEAAKAAQEEANAAQEEACGDSKE